jgi:hypothetical protein
MAEASSICPSQKEISKWYHPICSSSYLQTAKIKQWFPQLVVHRCMPCYNQKQLNIKYYILQFYKKNRMTVLQFWKKTTCQTSSYCNNYKHCYHSEFILIKYCVLKSSSRILPHLQAVNTCINLEEKQHLIINPSYHLGSEQNLHPLNIFCGYHILNCFLTLWQKTAWTTSCIESSCTTLELLHWWLHN